MFDVATRRLHAQRLLGAPCASVRDTVRHFGAVQAQDLAGALWAIAQRTADTTLADVEHAYDTGQILRLHVLRPTWHFVAPDDLRWLLALTAPRINQAMKTYDRKLELDDKVYARSNDAIAAALAEGPRTRAELTRALAKKRIVADGQRLAHLLMRAELDAVICSGPRRGADVTYALVADRVPTTPALDRDEALARLATRYIASHGPALDTDFAWWSGLALSDARRALAVAKLATHSVDDQAYYFIDEDIARPRTPRIHLLPNFDEYFVAYRQRSATLDPALARKLGSRADLIFNNAVIRNGALLGIWRRTARKAAVTLSIATTAPLTPGDRRALDTAVAAYAHYLARPVEVA